MVLSEFDIRWYDGLQYVAIIGAIALKTILLVTHVLRVPMEYLLLAFLLTLGIFCICYYRWLREFAVLRRTDILECKLFIKEDKCDMYINDVYMILIERVVWKDIDKPVLYPTRGVVALPRKHEVDNV